MSLRPRPSLLCMMLTLWSCQCAGTFTRRWCSQGRTESNCHSAGFGDRIPSRWVIPMRAEMRSPNRTRGEYIANQLKTARGVFPGGRLLAFALVRTYPETTPRGLPARSRYAHGSMNDGSDCRSIHSLLAFLCFTGRFLSLRLLSTVSVNDAIGNFISGPVFLVAVTATGMARAAL